jgi:GntR family transcriptional repressor for pyruvate dehydrogenase complex
MDEFNALSKEERYEMIVDKIISLIYEGKIKNGGKMFSENQFAKMLGVSRAHVREVYSALGIIGVLESRRGEGTFFNNKGNNLFLKLLFLTIYNDNVTVDDILELREIIEVGIAEKAAENRTEKDIKDLKRCIHKMEECDDGAGMSELDNELHSIIGRSSGNYILMSLSDIVSGLVNKSIREHWNYIVSDKNRSTKRKTFEQHKELVESIINKKPYIAKVIAQEHLEFVVESIARYRKEYAKKKETEKEG